MSGPIVRTGATPEFSDGWDRIFSDKKSKKSATSKPKAEKKDTKKKAAPKKKASKK